MVWVEGTGLGWGKEKDLGGAGKWGGGRKSAAVGRRKMGKTKERASERGRKGVGEGEEKRQRRGKEKVWGGGWKIVGVGQRIWRGFGRKKRGKEK